LTISEVNLLRDQGFFPVSLGSRVLRWETAALLCLGLFWWAGQPSSPEPEVGE
jgi:16S rRNA (uracil1498-N3)-methyltransferase